MSWCRSASCARCGTRRAADNAHGLPAGNRIMRRHRAIGSVDFGVVEGNLVNTALQIVGDKQFRDAADETEHAHTRAGPIRQLLRPGRLGISQVRSTEHSDKYLRFVNFACRRINNRYPACPSSLRTPFLRRRGVAASPGSAVARTREADRRACRYFADSSRVLCAGRKFWRGRAAFATQGKALQASSAPRR
jgi:hypothetical protein